VHELVNLTNDGVAVTTSLIIAEGTENDHSSVMRLVDTHLVDLQELGLVRLEIRPRLEGQHGGGNMKYVSLGQEPATLLLTLMRNNEVVVDFKKRLVKAFWELAKKAAIPTRQNRIEMARKILELEEEAAALEAKNQTLSCKVEELEPKAEAADLIRASRKSMNVTDAAKHLSTVERPIFRAFLIKWLKENGWAWKNAEKLRATKMAIDKGLAEQKYNDVNDIFVSDYMITSEGLVRLAEIFGRYTVTPSVFTEDEWTPPHFR